ncbi:hypothetical protein [Streptosporangium roseum]|uniref:hypothetical protein n=1 Tax=Streptosporangium roseum TaxID=2001 RepID=UPI003323D6CE
MGTSPASIPIRVRVAPASTMPPAKRQEWRWRLSAAAGKLAAAARAYQEAQDLWEGLLEEAQANEVPNHMITNALAGAGLEQDD